MPTEREILQSLADSIDVRGDVERARRRGDQLRRRRRIAVSAAVCVVAVIAGGLIAALADDAERNSQVDVLDRPPTATSAPGSSNIDEDPFASFETIAPPPVPIDFGTAVAPTMMGTLFVWGSEGGRQGALLDPPAITPNAAPMNKPQWRPMAEAPDELGVGPATAVAIGTTVIVVTGDMHADDAHAAAYDVDTDSWRMLPDPPFRRGERMTVGWDGYEAFFFEVALGDCVAEHQGFAFDPRRSEWRQLPDPPLGIRVSTANVWTGARLVVIGGSQQRCSVEPEDRRRDRAMYTPASDTWSEIPPHPTGNPKWAVAPGNEVVVFDDRCSDRCSAAAVYDTRSREWRDLGADGPPIFGRLALAHNGNVHTWDVDGRGRVLTASGWADRDGPALPPELAADPVNVHLVTTPGVIYALGPGRTAVYPSSALRERIRAQLAAADAAADLRIYASGPNFMPFEQLALADEVTFTFGTEVVGTRRRDALSDDSAWVFDYPDSTLDGSFSVLELLRDGGSPQVTGGDFERCDGSPAPWPPGSSDMFRSAYVFNAGRSCDEWWAIVVYVRDNQIAGIAYERGS